jgi:hypothetical protein
MRDYLLYIAPILPGAHSSATTWMVARLGSAA